jgi:hypothetical protein
MEQEEWLCVLRRECPAFRCAVPPDVSGDLCCICLEAKRDRQMLRKMGCGHDFHRGCFDSWFEFQSTRHRVMCSMFRWVPPSASR